MARQRASLPLPRVSLGGASTDSSSIASCISVADAREGSLASSAAVRPLSTPPTSVSDEADNINDKSTTGAAAEESNLARRSSRRKSGPATYNLGVLSTTRRSSAALDTAKDKANRCLSGDTLVGVTTATIAPSADTPNRQLLDDGVKALNMDWEMEALPGDNDEELPTKNKRRHRSSIDLLFESTGRAVNRVKSVLGKRPRSSDEPEQAGRRQSRRLVDLETKKQDEDEVEEETAKNERPSKLARLSSSFSLNMPSAFSGRTKRYESQGLYAGQTISSYADQGAISKPAHKGASKPRPKSTSFLPDPTKDDKQSSLLSLPMFSYIERKEGPFTIPFDVFAPVFHQRGEEKPKDWGKINKNRFVGDAKGHWKKKSKQEISICVCSPSAPGSSEPLCTEGCLNRSMEYECDEDNCIYPDQCTNRDFAELATRVQTASKCGKKSANYLFQTGVDVVKTQDRGFGVVATRSFEPGQIITEYTGEIITPEEAARRIAEDYKDKENYYQMEFDKGMILDGTRGSIARFVNHACEPNCSVIKRFVAGIPRMALFAGDRGIMTGEELTYDYNFDPYSTKSVQDCRCGSTNCRGVLGPREKGSKKPVTKKDKENMAAGMKRNAGDLHSTTSAIEIDMSLFETRKVPQVAREWPRGWAYKDPELEKLRAEEAHKDREIARLQKAGVDLRGFAVKQVTSTTTTTKEKGGARRFIDKVTTKVTGHRQKATPAKKPGMLNRVSGSIKQKDRSTVQAEMAAGSARKGKVGRRSMDSVPKGSLKVRAVTANAAKMTRTMRAVKAGE